MNKLKSNILLYMTILCTAVYIGVFIGRTSSANSLFVPLVVHTDSDSVTAGVNAVDLNSATDAELMTIAEIDAAIAQAIVEYREENGNFVSCLELIRVDGITYERYQKIKPYVTVGGA